MNKSVIVAGTAFLIFLSLVVYLFLHLLSSLPEEHRDKFTLPRTLDDARELRDVLMIYVETSYWSALFGVFVFYVFLQTFSIPGSIFLNVVAGAIFGLPVGLFATHTAACCGASLAFFLSSFIGRGIATAFFPQMLDRFQAKLDEHWNNLFNYLLFLRLTPFLPNWFINLASPILSVPYSKFLLATYLGILPQQFLTVKAGATVQEMSTGMDAKSIIFLIFLGFLCLLPAWKPFQDKLNALFGKGKDM